MRYEKPDFEVTVFEIEDVITTSGNPEQQLLNDEPGWYE